MKVNMIMLLIPLLCILSSATSLQNKRFADYETYTTAATAAQVKFAIENKYDDTGPAEKRPVYAYNTYNNLEDALLAYLDDTDTQLPEHERMKAYRRLLSKLPLPNPVHKNGYKYYQNAYQVVDQPPIPTMLQTSFPHNNKSVEPLRDFENHQIKAVKDNTVYTPLKELFKFQKFQAVKDSSISLAHYTRERDPSYFDLPKYSYTYGVHSPETGDIKRVAETRDGNTVVGFYSFIDSDGKRRVVNYKSEGPRGFTANVQKFPIAP